MLPHLRAYVEKAVGAISADQWENFLASFNADMDNCADQVIGELLENFEVEA